MEPRIKVFARGPSDWSLHVPQRVSSFGLFSDLSSFVGAVLFFFVLDGSLLGLGRSDERFEPIEIALSGVLLVRGTLRHHRRRFHVVDDSLVLESGIWTRSSATIELDDVQSVELQTRPLHRWLGLTEIVIRESSGRSKVALKPLRLEVARALETLVRARIDSDEPPPADAERPASDPDPAPMRIEPARSGVLRVDSVRLLAAALVVGTLAYVAQRWVGRYALLLPALGLVTAVTVVSRNLSFRAEIDRSGIGVSSGVLTRLAKVVSSANIQAVSVARGPFLRLFGLEQITVIDASGTDETPSVLAPVWPLGRWPEVVRHVFADGTIVDESDLEPISARSIARTRAQIAAVALALVVLCLTVRPVVTTAVVTTAVVIGVVVIGAGAAAAWYPRRRVARFGITRSDSHVLVRSGIVVERVRVVPIDRIEFVSVSSSFGQSRRGLASLRLSATGDRSLVTLRDLDAGFAAGLLDDLTLASHERARPWADPNTTHDTGERRLPRRARTRVLATSAAEAITLVLLAALALVLGRAGVVEVPPTIVVGVLAVVLGVSAIGLVAQLVEHQSFRWRATEAYVQTESTVMWSTVSLVFRRSVHTSARTRGITDRWFDLHRVSLHTAGAVSPDLELRGLDEHDVAAVLEPPGLGDSASPPAT